MGDATVAMADVQASNGVVHVIDSVLMPAEQ
ncbi:fasciclin domain-containing protein [Solirubrobacter deserti]|uniref:Fasciclin domain-containing protein n=1 Tax=Solirubrobacter deserti TaxID=2282478 RepID=A0ABT4RQK8_9ACTN|nr:fasciclin domain-containing protein [Solirubrobacter deserti]MDA0140819.1 fasciclin domain-containing protein [Solirubrobacter deserti]